MSTAPVDRLYGYLRAPVACVFSTGENAGNEGCDFPQFQLLERRCLMVSVIMEAMKPLATTYRRMGDWII